LGEKNVKMAEAPPILGNMRDVIDFLVRARREADSYRDAAALLHQKWVTTRQTLDQVHKKIAEYQARVSEVANVRAVLELAAALPKSVTPKTLMDVDKKLVRLLVTSPPQTPEEWQQQLLSVKKEEKKQENKAEVEAVRALFARIRQLGLPLSAETRELLYSCLFRQRLKFSLYRFAAASLPVELKKEYKSFWKTASKILHPDKCIRTPEDEGALTELVNRELGPFFSGSPSARQFAAALIRLRPFFSPEVCRDLWKILPAVPDT
jgi:hypothetical protein